MTDEDTEGKELIESNVSLETEETEETEEVTEAGIMPESAVAQDDYVNPRGVRFTPQEPIKEGTVRFLINLFFLENPYPKQPNLSNCGD